MIIVADSRQQRGESGQVLPLLLILLTIICLIFIGMTQSMRECHNSLTRSEKNFQLKFNRSMGIAYRLNVISENNGLMLRALNGLLKLYLNGTANAIDLAASTPVWERALPVPTPEKVFAPFDAALRPVANYLSSLESENGRLLQDIPQQVRSRVQQLSMKESVCALSSSQSPLLGQRYPTQSCRWLLDFSLFAAPHLRTIRDPSDFLSRLNITRGFTLIHIGQNFSLDDPIRAEASKTPSGPFERARIFLTHASFCPTIVRLDLKSLCPTVETRRFRSRAPDNATDLGKNVSFEPQWSVSVEN